MSLLSSFDPPGGGLNAIGFHAGVIYAHVSNTTTLQRYNADGTSFGADLAWVPGGGNDSDIDFSITPLEIGGILVPAGTMLVTQGEPSTQTLYAVDAGTGSILASQDLAEPIGQLTGGAIDPFSGMLYTIDWTNDVIRVFDPSTGVAGVSFGFGGNFDAFYSDVEISASTGELFLVSSSQNVIRVLSASGEFLRDINVDDLGISGMSGIAFDDRTGDAWISSTNGSIYRVGGLTAGVPAPASAALLGLGSLMVTSRRRSR
ncbi:MAG: hypothetical protein CMJ31_02050 [Phycisphaerae bacterium]|nr:hypothetical protein [Phycisphaerae bacterium]